MCRSCVCTIRESKQVCGGVGRIQTQENFCSKRIKSVLGDLVPAHLHRRNTRKPTDGPLCANRQKGGQTDRQTDRQTDTHTHTHTHTHRRTRTLARIPNTTGHAITHAQRRTHTHAHSLTLTHTHAHSSTNTHTHTHAHSPGCRRRTAL